MNQLVTIFFFLHSGNVCKSGFDEYDSKMIDLLKNLLTEGQKPDKKFPFKKSLKGALSGLK